MRQVGLGRRRAEIDVLSSHVACQEKGRPVGAALLSFVAVAIAIQFPTWATVTTLAIIISFQLVTVPVATHMVGRAGYRTKHLRRSMLYRDELAEAVDRAEAREVARERRREFGTDENDG